MTIVDPNAGSNLLVYSDHFRRRPVFLVGLGGLVEHSVLSKFSIAKLGFLVYFFRFLSIGWNRIVMTFIDQSLSVVLDLIIIGGTWSATH